MLVLPQTQDLNTHMIAHPQRRVTFIDSKTQKGQQSNFTASQQEANAVEVVNGFNQQAVSSSVCLIVVSTKQRGTNSKLKLLRSYRVDSFLTFFVTQWQLRKHPM